jgi:hypothetical protein
MLISLTCCNKLLVVSFNNKPLLLTMSEVRSLRSGPVLLGDGVDALLGCEHLFVSSHGQKTEKGNKLLFILKNKVINPIHEALSS